MTNTPKSSNSTNNLTLFFGLVLIISLPFYFIASLVPQEMTILMGLGLTLAPIAAGLILTYREKGSEGVKRLLKRSFDYKRIANRIWYLPILFLWPVIFILAFWVNTFMGETAPDPLFPVFAAPILLVLFFIFALFEEVSWMGYAFGPMENRWHALKASLILGLIWAIWHLPLYILAGQEPLWIAGQFISLIAIRILIVWIFNNTQKSVFAAILFHAVYNVCTITITSFYTGTGHLITSILILITTIAVILLWDADTLTKFKFGKRPQTDQN